MGALVPLVGQLIGIFAPIVSDIIKKHQAANNGTTPTDDEIKAEFLANVDLYLGEGSAWRAAHPNA